MLVLVSDSAQALSSNYAFTSTQRSPTQHRLHYLTIINVLGLHDDNTPCYVKHCSPYATSRSRMVNGMTFHDVSSLDLKMSLTSLTPVCPV